MISGLAFIFAVVIGWYAPKQIALWMGRKGFRPVLLIPVWLAFAILGFATSMGAVAVFRNQSFLHSALVIPFFATLVVAPLALWQGKKKANAQEGTSRTQR